MGKDRPRKGPKMHNPFGMALDHGEEFTGLNVGPMQYNNAELENELAELLGTAIYNTSFRVDGLHPYLRYSQHRHILIKFV